jgi:hypothetical protein
MLKAADQPIDNGSAYPQREQSLVNGGNMMWGGAILNHF